MDKNDSVRGCNRLKEDWEKGEEDQNEEKEEEKEEEEVKKIRRRRRGKGRIEKKNSEEKKARLRKINIKSGGGENCLSSAFALYIPNICQSFLVQ